MTTIAVLDYGMGNLRSVEKALEHVGAEAVVTADPDARRASADGLVLPGVGAFAEAMERIRELELDAPDRRAGRGRHAGARASASAMQLLFESSTELGGAAGPRAARRARSTALDAPRAEGPAHRLGAGRLARRPRELTRRDRRRDARSTSSTASPRARRRRRRARRRRVRRALRLRDRPRRRSTASSSTPRSRAPRACALLANFAADLRRAVAGLILYPAIDIRDGRAVRLVQGDYDRETAFDADPLDAARRWVEQGARRTARRRPRRRARRRAGEHRARRADLRRGGRPGPGRRRAARGRRRRSGARRRARRGRSSAPRRSPTRPWSRRWSPSTATRIVVSADAAAGASPSRAGSGRPEPSAAELIADLADRGVRDLRLHAGRGRRDARGPGARRASPVAAAAAAAGARADLLGRGRHARRICATLADAGAPGGSTG